MNSQEVTQLVKSQLKQFQQKLGQSLREQVAKQLSDSLPMGRDQAQPMEDDGSGRRPPNGDDLSDTSIDGPDWSEYLTGAKQTPVSIPGNALSDLLGKPLALALIRVVFPPHTLEPRIGKGVGGGDNISLMAGKIVQRCRNFAADHVSKAISFCSAA